MNPISRFFKDEKDSEVRKNFRLMNPVLERISFQFNQYTYQISNLSLGGMGIVIPENHRFPLGGQLNGAILFGEEICPVKIEFVHITNNIVGAKVIDNQSQFAQRLHQYFESEFEGLKVKKMDEAKLNPRKEGTPHWFYSDPQHELFFLTNDQEINFFQLNFQGLIIEMNLKGNITFGEVKEDNQKKMKGSDLIVGTEEKMDVVSYALRFLQYIEELEENHKIFIKEKIEKAYFAKKR